MKHKHADLIIAWANGAEIEYFNGINHEWRTFVKDHNVWYEDWEYRIKPEEKTDFAVSANVVFKLGLNGDYLEFSKTGKHNIEFVFDGTTQKLKATRPYKND